MCTYSTLKILAWVPLKSAVFLWHCLKGMKMEKEAGVCLNYNEDTNQIMKLKLFKIFPTFANIVFFSFFCSISQFKWQIQRHVVVSIKLNKYITKQAKISFGNCLPLRIDPTMHVNDVQSTRYNSNPLYETAATAVGIGWSSFYWKLFARWIRMKSKQKSIEELAKSVFTTCNDLGTITKGKKDTMQGIEHK